MSNGRKLRWEGNKVEHGGKGGVKAILTDKFGGNWARELACMPKGHTGPKEGLESSGEGDVIWHGAKESSNIGFINVYILNELWDGCRRGCRGVSNGMLLARPNRCISKVWEASAARELSVYVSVTKNIIVNARTTQV